MQYLGCGTAGTAQGGGDGVMVSGPLVRHRLLELGLLTLEERQHQMDMAQVYKMLTGKDNVDNEALFTMANTHCRHTWTRLSAYARGYRAWR